MKIIKPKTSCSIRVETSCISRAVCSWSAESGVEGNLRVENIGSYSGVCGFESGYAGAEFGVVGADDAGFGGGDRVAVGEHHGGFVDG
jgi:hypothetical protein